MQPTAPFSAAALARSLLRRRRQGALATLAVGTGAPYCSLVNLASHWDGSPILLISRLALHTQNILADPRVSLMLDERAEGDPLEGARIMLSGTAVEIGGDEVNAVRQRYLHAHPAAEMFAGFADFGFFVIRPSGAHLVAGFGRIVDLKPDQFLTDLAGAHALLAEENGIIAHMNADHLSTMKLYAHHLGAPEGDWRCTGCDPEGLDLQAGTTTLRVSFPQRALNSAALRNALKQLADLARSAAKLDPHQSSRAE
jgi:hypothetical protein